MRAAIGLGGIEPLTWHEKQLVGAATTKVMVLNGVSSRNGKNRTLSLAEHPQRPELALFDLLALLPDVVAGQVDVLPAQWRQVLQ